LQAHTFKDLDAFLLHESAPEPDGLASLSMQPLQVLGLKSVASAPPHLHLPLAFCMEGYVFTFLVSLGIVAHGFTASLEILPALNLTVSTTVLRAIEHSDARVASSYHLIAGFRSIALYWG
jgi:hypothetical protein